MLGLLTLSLSLHSVEFLLLTLFQFDRILEPLFQHMVGFCPPRFPLVFHHLGDAATRGVDHMGGFTYPRSRQQSETRFQYFYTLLKVSISPAPECNEEPLEGVPPLQSFHHHHLDTREHFRQRIAGHKTVAHFHFQIFDGQLPLSSLFLF